MNIIRIKTSLSSSAYLRTALALIFFIAVSSFARCQAQSSVSSKKGVCFTLYTVHENTLKLTAQFYPIKDFEPFETKLQTKADDEWITVDSTRIIYPGYTAPFRVENWDDSKEVIYRVLHNEKNTYEGIIKANPINKEEIVMAAFSCNSTYKRHDGDISRQDIVDNINFIDPDLLFFSGDQVYDHSSHYELWLKFGEDFGEITRNRPTIVIPDDHDIGQANFWGENGKKARDRFGEDGGFYMPIEYVEEVQRAQTSHLPDPYDPTPVEQGISVYYTDLKWGGISFAILEDRKFKTGPERFTKTLGKSLWEDWSDIDPKLMDQEGTKLLGERQMEFLKTWTTDWEDTEMKAVLSQTVFAMSTNFTEKFPGEMNMDFDSNGWPQSGRNEALEEIRKSYSCMIAGDQHLGTVLRHGVDDWNDAGVSFAVPAIANFWCRWWLPTTPGQNTLKGAPAYTGDYLDGFGNKITMYAAANPDRDLTQEGGKLTTRAAGFGVIRFNKTQRKITFECWGRNVDVSDPMAKQFPGWPISFDQTDNYQMKNGLELPTLVTSKANQVITVMEATTNEVISSLRIKGNSYQPKVKEMGVYKIKVGEKELLNMEPKKRNKKTINIDL